MPIHSEIRNTWISFSEITASAVTIHTDEVGTANPAGRRKEAGRFQHSNAHSVERAAAGKVARGGGNQRLEMRAVRALLHLEPRSGFDSRRARRAESGTG